MMASVITASFVVSAVGAYLVADGSTYGPCHDLSCGVGVIAGLLSCVLVGFSGRGRQGKMVAEHQPATLAAMEGLFEGGPYAELAIIGQPNVEAGKLENPIVVPGVLSFLAYGTFGSTVKGLNDFPATNGPRTSNCSIIAYHIMVGLGTIFSSRDGRRGLAALARQASQVAADALGAHALRSFSLHRHDGRLVDGGAGPTALGRYTACFAPTQAGSPQVNTGDVVFTTLGFAGLYLLLGILFVFQVMQEVVRGPVTASLGDDDGNGLVRHRVRDADGLCDP